MAKRSKFGKAQLEESWQSTEVDTIYRLERAGVRVPKPHLFSDGVLIMELVVDGSGNAAPRLNDIQLSAALARTYHAFMLQQIVRMLCAGLIHGDLSEYNVLVDADGPVVIDFPQAVDAAGNQSAKRMFLRDVDNMRDYFSRFAPEFKSTNYGKEIWKLYEHGELEPETELTGLVEEETGEANVDGVLQDIEDAREEHYRRFGRKVVDIAPPTPVRPAKSASPGPGKGGPKAAGPHDGPPKKRRRRRRKPSNGAASPASPGPDNRQNAAPAAPAAPAARSASDTGPPKKRRRRRRRRSGARAPQASSAS